MKLNKLIVAVAVFAATSSAFAQQTQFIAPDAGFKSTLTRAEVRQEMVQAHSQGQVVQRQRDGQDLTPVLSTRTREEVRAEATQARQNGDTNSPYFG